MSMPFNSEKTHHSIPIIFYCVVGGISGHGIQEALSSCIHMKLGFHCIFGTNLIPKFSTL